MNAEHAPGPWETVQFCANSIDIIGAQGIYCAEVVSFHDECNATDQANARLISAAPELYAYAECEEARSRANEGVAETVLTRHGWGGDCTAQEFVDRLRRAAIQKATGGGV